MFGVHSGMPLRTAARRCPDAVFLPVDRAAYEPRPRRSWRRCGSLDAVVEVLGWDEAFVAVETDDPEAFARQVQRPVRDGDAAGLLGRHRREQAAGQDRHRVRQAGRGLPADHGDLVRACWATGRPMRCGASAPRPRPSSPRSASRPSAELAAADPARLAGSSARRSGPGWCRPRAARPSPVTAEPYVPRGHGREVTFQHNLADWDRSRRGGAARPPGHRRHRRPTAAGDPGVVKVRYAPFVTSTHGAALPGPTATRQRSRRRRWRPSTVHRPARAPAGRPRRARSDGSLERGLATTRPAVGEDGCHVHLRKAAIRARDRRPGLVGGS